MATTPAPVTLPTTLENIEAKAALIKTIIVTHLASLESETAIALKEFSTQGAALPAELTALAAALTTILPELQAVGADFFTILQMVAQVIQVKAITPAA